MCHQFFLKETTLFTPKNTLLERILATSLANYEEDSLDGDSFVSQSRFDAYATYNGMRAVKDGEESSNKTNAYPNIDGTIFI